MSPMLLLKPSGVRTWRMGSLFRGFNGWQEAGKMIRKSHHMKSLQLLHFSLQAVIQGWDDILWSMFLCHILPSSLLLELIIIIFRPFRLLAFNQCLRARILWKIHSWQSFSQCGSKARSTEKGCKSDAVVSWIFPHLILRTSYIRTYLELPCM